MAKADIIVSGTDATVKFNSGTAMADVNTIAFGVVSERDEINLSTLGNAKYEVLRLGDLVSVEDITVNKKFDPAAELALSDENKALVVEFKVGDASAKTISYWAQVKDVTPGTVERSPGEGINVDIVFAVTNLNASLVEEGPTGSALV